MLTLLLTHIAGIAASSAMGRISTRAALATAAIPSTFSTAWVVGKLLGESEPVSETYTWVGGLGLSFSFESNDLALLMALLVSGIGVLVFVYSIGYFGSNTTPDSKFAPSLLAFSGSMLGLVLSDSVWSLFIFWELTSITSFLLVGYKNQYEHVRTAARRALVITATGGLVLLAGLITLTEGQTDAKLGELVTPAGVAGTTAAVLIIIGAATKSAQFPFHVWLPGAMEAPTPVSAYLHSATMVKAGVFLIAVVGPAFNGLDSWKYLGLAFGITSMIWGALGALRQIDAKLILAWGTISQLGLITTLLSLGDPKATFAGVAMILAHAIFKATLFMVIGEVDVRCGTRSILELGGLARKMPIAFAVALISGLSMVGMGPVLGFLTKEAALEAALGLTGVDRTIVLLTVVSGSVLTVAYTLRFIVGVFGPGAETQVSPRRSAMTVPSALLASVSLLGFLVVGAATSLSQRAAGIINEQSNAFDLIQWPGLKTAFVLSLAITGLGVGLGYAWHKARYRFNTANTTGANFVDDLLNVILKRSPAAIKRIQHGSLPVYLMTLAAVAALTGLVFVGSLSTTNFVFADSVMQGVLALGILASSIGVATVKTRFGAALALGAVGIFMSGLFVIHGAPDLALTQILVETIVVVGFVLGLGKLATEFPKSSGSWVASRLVVSVLAGLAVVIGLAVATQNSVALAPVAELSEASVSDGGGNNIVNVILTDLRALDTLGEVVVLAMVAVGLLALAQVTRREVVRD